MRDLLDNTLLKCRYLKKWFLSIKFLLHVLKGGKVGVNIWICHLCHLSSGYYSQLEPPKVGLEVKSEMGKLKAGA